MSLLCPTSCHKSCTNSCRSNNSCTCNCTCKCSCPQPQPIVCQPCTDQVAGEETVEPVTVRALLQTVMDSCCTTDDICREITVNCPDIFDPCELQPGSVLSVELDGDVTYKEVKRDKDDCTCVSTVRFNIPIRIYGTEKCCCSQYITRNITVIRSVKLCCASDSELTANNSKVIALSAVVTEVCGCEVTFTLCLLFRSCLQQTLIREYSWQATPVCSTPNCGDARNLLSDPCDLTCGCTAGSTKSCPSC